MPIYLDKQTIKQDYPTLYNVFYAPQDPTSPRGDNETLHDYLTRKGIDCFCKPCFYKKKASHQTEKTQINKHERRIRLYP